MLGRVTRSQESSPFTAMEDVKSISLVPNQLNPDPMARPPAPATPCGTGCSAARAAGHRTASSP